MITIDYNKALASQKFDYPYIFYDNIGTDIQLQSTIKIIKNWDKNNTNNAREVNIKLTSFKNIINNAKHYYCTFIIDGISLLDEEKNKFVYISNPLLQPQYKVKLYHPLTTEDMQETDTKGSYRYNSLWYKEGDYVDSFNNINDIFDFSFKVIKERFKGNWKFYLLGLSSKKDLIAEMINNELTINNSIIDGYFK